MLAHSVDFSILGSFERSPQGVNESKINIVREQKLMKFKSNKMYKD